MEMMEKYAPTIEQKNELENDLIEFAKIVSDMQAEKLRKALNDREEYKLSKQRYVMKTVKNLKSIPSYLRTSVNQIMEFLEASEPNLFNKFSTIEIFSLWDRYSSEIYEAGFIDVNENSLSYFVEWVYEQENAMKFCVKVIDVPKKEWVFGIDIEHEHNVFEHCYETYLAISLFKKIILIGYMMV